MPFTPVIAQRYLVSGISYTTVTISVHRAKRERIRVSLYPGEILIHFLVVQTRTLVTMFMTTDLVLCVIESARSFSGVIDRVSIVLSLSLSLRTLSLHSRNRTVLRLAEAVNYQRIFAPSDRNCKVIIIIILYKHFIL